MDFNEIIKATMVLFAVIDVIGSIPVIINIKKKAGEIHPLRASLVAFGIIYNTARISFSESMRDLASLRVIGFTKGEASYVLLGELAVVVLVALPLGALMGYFLSFAISAGFSTDIYQVPSVFNPSGYGTAVLVVLAASIVSGWIVKRDVDRVDLVEALKIKE